MCKLVSVIIPTYSRPDNIIRAIKSVEQQTYPNIEIVVVDDNGEGSPHQKETEKVLRSRIAEGSIKYIPHKENKNGSAARNTGIMSSKGDYITFLDDDDEYMPTKITRQVEAIETLEGTDVAASYCGHRKCSGDKIVSESIAQKSGNLQKEVLLQKWGFGTGSNPLFKREVFDKVGLFDVTFKRKQDIEFMIRFFRFYKIACVPDILVVKNIDSKINRPPADLFVQVVDHFLRTFETDINNYSQEIRNSIYFQSYMQNAIFALNESKYKLAFKIIRKATSYKSLSIREMLRVVKYIFVKKTIR